MKKQMLFATVLPMFILAGCGVGPSTGGPTTNQPPASTSTSTSESTSTSQGSAPANATPSLSQQNIALTVLPGGRLGSDGKMHDTFAPANFTVVQGVPVTLTVLNYDDGQHTVTNGDLGLNLMVKPHLQKGTPSVNTVTFTPSKAGDFTWQCMQPCDSDNGDWAMAQNGYMRGTIHVVPNTTPQQWIDLTIKDGLEFAAADGKLHDAYSPANFTVQQGIPVTVSVENFDTGEHSFTAPDLGINQTLKAAAKDGQPSETTFTFTPSKSGTFHWQCIIQCDGTGGWAMTHDGYMAGNVTVTP